MSLKAVHLFFVATFTALCFGCGVWKLRDYAQTREATGDLVFGVVALLMGVAVIIYGRYFLKKLKKIGYL
jgi:hypothetical protein